jgi:hypothetical protein
MAVDRPTGPRREAEVRTLDEVRVGHRTAASFGWIREAQADLFYQPPEVSAQEKLRPAGVEAAEVAPVAAPEEPGTEPAPSPAEPAAP